MQYFLLFSSFLVLTSCGSPRSYLDKTIIDKNFIPFQLPLESTRVGTMLKGDNNSMYVVARPERCFPDLPGDQALRWLQKTDLPNEHKKMELKFGAEANDALIGGNKLLEFKLEAAFVKNVQLSFEGATVEFLDEWAFEDYWNSGMSSRCKTKLQEYPFIVQGLRVDKMSFQFYNAAGALINLSANLDKIVNIGIDASWKIENSYTLTIDTPKYIGYRMGQISLEDGLPTLKYASEVNNSGQWIFKGLDEKSLNSLRWAEPAEMLAP